MGKLSKHQFSQNEIWQKFKKVRGIRGLIEHALILYCLILDGDVSKWAKTVCMTALCYLVLPIDSIPDVIPVMGYSDDLICLAAAIAAMNSQIKPHHKQQAQEMFNQL